MASSLRMAAPKMASLAAQSSVKVARSPMMKARQVQKFTRAYSGERPPSQKRQTDGEGPRLTIPPPFSAATARSNTAFTLAKRTSPLLHAARTQFAAPAARRAYSSEMANALVQVSQNIGKGNAAIGLGGAGIGIGLVFAALLSAVARNPSLRGQLFSYAILGFAFVEAIGLFDLMVAMMCKYV
ncbi:ATPase complex subunit 9 [Teratosphaeriaceae sp. CCFEE 6253]|nr:ATPase complex subunit 9 [Teratosphaeriaceae sp. CCFEE 6253]